MIKPVKRLFELWNSVVRDPKDSAKIDKLFIENGFPQHAPYTNQPGAEYCGHTAAYAYRGILPDDFLKSIFSSTTRLFDRGPRTWSEFGFDRDMHVIDDPMKIKAGDVVVVVTSGRKAWGDHITVASDAVMPHGKFFTIEGNARGLRGDGTWGKGVVMRLRDISEVRQILRFGAAEATFGLDHGE
jgi:hypothetical protein